MWPLTCRTTGQKRISEINVLRPELLFVMMALNDFILLYAKKKARISYRSVLDRHDPICFRHR